jgi:hypothetical protein
MPDRALPEPGALAWWAGLVAITELVLLRMGTRTLVHIPGVEVVSGPLAWLSEAGRFAYYLSLVLVVGVGALLLAIWWASSSPRRWFGISAIALVALAAVLGAIGAVTPSLVGWLSLAAPLALIVGLAGAGRGAIPLLLWTGAAWSAGFATLFQGSGGGLSGEAMAALLQWGDVLVVAGALTFPLLLRRPPGVASLGTGLAVAAVVTALLTWASSTTAILALWAFGITASLPTVFYGLAAGSMAATVHEASRRGNRSLAGAAMLVMAGGIGLISTYQTALLVVGLALATSCLSPFPGEEPAMSTRRPSIAVSG